MSASKGRKLPATCDCGRPAVYVVSSGVECDVCREIRLRMWRTNEAPRRMKAERK